MPRSKPDPVDDKVPAGAHVIEESDQDDPPAEETPVAKKPKNALHRPARDRRQHPLVGRPNIPSFDHNGAKEPKPVLEPGEKVIKEGTKHGLKYAWTSHARMIFLCTIEEYLEAVGPLIPSAAIYRRWFPKATSEE